MEYVVPSLSLAFLLVVVLLSLSASNGDDGLTVALLAASRWFFALALFTRRFRRLLPICFISAAREGLAALREAEEVPVKRPRGRRTAEGL